MIFETTFLIDRIGPIFPIACKGMPQLRRDARVFGGFARLEVPPLKGYTAHALPKHGSASGCFLYPSLVCGKYIPGSAFHFFSRKPSSVSARLGMWPWTMQRYSLVSSPLFDFLVHNAQGLCVFGGHHNSAGVAVDTVYQRRGKGGLVLRLEFSFSIEIMLNPRDQRIKMVVFVGGEQSTQAFCPAASNFRLRRGC